MVGVEGAEIVMDREFTRGVWIGLGVVFVSSFTPEPMLIAAVIVAVFAIMLGIEER